jgi:hypothetical protein
MKNKDYAGRLIEWHSPLKAISGKTSKSNGLVSSPPIFFIAVLRSSSARRILYSTFPRRGANCKVPILMAASPVGWLLPVRVARGFSGFLVGWLGQHLSFGDGNYLSQH